jgi:hypothetical protein
MVHRLLCISVVLALTVVGSATAAELLFAWEFPADVTPPPESFLITYFSATAPTQPHQWRFPNQGRASCNALPPAGLTPDSVCGRAPECLPPGIYAFWIQAESGGEQSDMSNLANCEARAGCTYTCDSVTVPPALQQLMQGEGPGGAQPPDPAAVQQAVASLAQTPITPASPSITAPAPQVSRVVDPVQAALNQLPRTPV